MYIAGGNAPFKELRSFGRECLSYTLRRDVVVCYTQSIVIGGYIMLVGSQLVFEKKADAFMRCRDRYGGELEIVISGVYIIHTLSPGTIYRVL